ncbi:aminoacyl-tRNA hydrolase [Gordonia sesuvii]|uniref:aminoacyl-tRNA hydrolase n=1 Tax=Gordonia sesuvii TaxID=3116777 RepID=UPI003D67F7EE
MTGRSPHPIGDFSGPADSDTDTRLAFEDAYRRLADYRGGGSDPADPGDVLAMQMVIRIEKSHPPARVDALTAAARAVALLCLDDRAGGAGPWVSDLDAWCGARIRKIARRARGAQWAAAQEVWGLTVETGSAQARALVPGRVGDVDRRIARLQIGGTELDGSLSTQAPDRGVCLWMNPDLPMTVGKAAAQVGHASMLAVTSMTLEQAWEWRSAGCPLVVREASGQRWADLLTADARGAAIAVRDAGFTEIAPGSVTVIAEVTDR